MSYRAGYVAIVGRPNVGKSTLMNQLIGQKVAITSSRVQTTRFRIRGVMTVEGRGQVVFLDTPGFSKPLDELGTFMTQEGHQALHEAQAVLMVVDGSAMCGSGDEWLAERVKETALPVVLVINKIDQVSDKVRRENIRLSYLKLFEGLQAFDYLTVSAKTGKRMAELPRKIFKCLPEGENIYDPELVTDMNLREIAQEMIREKLMRYTEDELPHSVAVVLEEFNESDPACTRITAVLYVDQKSQKGMIIGKGGQKIKQIGQAARQDIEAMVETQVFLDLTVKVKENWRKDPQFLKIIGVQS